MVKVNRTEEGQIISLPITDHANTYALVLKMKMYNSAIALHTRNNDSMYQIIYVHCKLFWIYKHVSITCHVIYHE